MPLKILQYSILIGGLIFFSPFPYAVGKKGKKGEGERTLGGLRTKKSLSTLRESRTGTGTGTGTGANKLSKKGVLTPRLLSARPIGTFSRRLASEGATNFGADRSDQKDDLPENNRPNRLVDLKFRLKLDLGVDEETVKSPREKGAALHREHQAALKEVETLRRKLERKEKEKKSIDQFIDVEKEKGEKTPEDIEKLVKNSDLVDKAIKRIRGELRLKTNKLIELRAQYQLVVSTNRMNKIKSESFTYLKRVSENDFSDADSYNGEKLLKVIQENMRGFSNSIAGKSWLSKEGSFFNEGNLTLKRGLWVAKNLNDYVDQEKDRPAIIDGDFFSSRSIDLYYKFQQDCLNNS